MTETGKGLKVKQLQGQTHSGLDFPQSLGARANTQRQACLRSLLVHLENLINPNDGAGGAHLAQKGAARPSPRLTCVETRDGPMSVTVQCPNRIEPKHGVRLATWVNSTRLAWADGSASMPP